MTKLAMPLPMDQIRAFCEKWQIARLEVFGSILRDDFRPESDVDFLVTWKAEARWSFADYLRAEQELAGIVGRRVDLVERSAVQDSRNWLRKSRILSSAEVVHAA